MKIYTKLILLFVLLCSNDTIYSDQIETNNYSNYSLQIDDCQCNIYDRPYSFWEKCPPHKGLLRNTGIFVGGSVGIMGILYLLPESATKWDKKSFTFENVFGKWWKNVKAGPVIDDDTWFMNYVAHPYWGGVFYMSARSLGYDPFYSFLYNAALSTFLWEYGIEAFAEIPSIQDLIVTPVAGSIVGELFYLAKREIVKNDYRVLNSKFIGHLLAFLIDPTNEVVNWFSSTKNNTSSSMMCYPILKSNQKLHLSFSFVYSF